MVEQSEAGGDRFTSSLGRFVSRLSYLTPEEMMSSGWLKHAPFAFWLVESLRPHKFVELGTHQGFSFFAVCQAVKKLNLDTACYAIATWGGDEHAGFYDAAVYERVAELNEKYSNFATLVKSTFKDALAYFPDGSVDLLHIDGRHFYADAKDDFESWTPKLARNAIVLFHDINVRERGFGVWKLWEELKERHPTFEFKHGNGLGIVATAAVPERLQALFDATAEEAEGTRYVYSQLGRAVEATWAANSHAALLVQERDAQCQLFDQERGLLTARFDMKVENEVGRRTADLQSRLEDAQYHLSRLNAYGWTRAGLTLDRGVKRLFDLLLKKNRFSTDQIPSLALLRQLPHRADAPDVSVLILSYGQVDYTRRCLASIIASDCQWKLEIIVSDDGSEDPALRSLEKIENLLLLRSPGNLGFLRHANWAVQQCKGAYVLLMNNDTEFQPRAIDALYELATSDKEIGLVGSKLIYPDGTLQEAGGIVWSDASAWNFGRGQDPKRPEFEYVHEADYISGASIMFPLSVWNDLRGFDERYVPAYYEDTDFAFRVREAGYKVMYCPRSVVVHHEGVSHGTNVSSGIKAHQVTNHAKMLDRWHDVLSAQHYPEGTHVLRARDRAAEKIVVLFVDHYVLEPDRDAGSRNALEMMRSLQQYGAIVKFWPDSLSRTEPYTHQLQQIGIEVLYSPYVESFDHWLADHADDIDVVIVARPQVAPPYMEALIRFAPAIARIYYGSDLHFQRMSMEARVLKDLKVEKAAQAMKFREWMIWRDADVVIYPSEEEARAVKEIDKSLEALSIIPFCFDTFPPLAPPPTSKDVLFVAGFGHPPNIDAAGWLAQLIFPLVATAIPAAKLWIAGSHPTSEVQALQCANVVVTGTLTTEELDALYQKARVAVVPLRFGAGVKLKVVEALQRGLPLVTTPVGAQGLPGIEEVAVVSNDESSIAQAVIRLLDDDDEWRAQGARQQDFARDRFSRRRSVDAMAKAVEASLQRARLRQQGRTAASN